MTYCHTWYRSLSVCHGLRIPPIFDVCEDKLLPFCCAKSASCPPDWPDTWPEICGWACILFHCVLTPKVLVHAKFWTKSIRHLLLCYLCDITTDAGSTFLTPRNIIWQKCSHLWLIAMLIISSSSHNTISRSLLISNSLNLVKPSNKWNRQTMIDVTIAYIHIKDFNDPSSNIQNPPLYFKLSNSATAWTSN